MELFFKINHLLLPEMDYEFRIRGTFTENQ